MKYRPELTIIMKKLLHLVLLSLVIYSIYAHEALAWNDDVTHKDLTDRAIDASSFLHSDANNLQSIGFTENLNEVLFWKNHVCDDKTKKKKCNIRDWLKYGAEKEDAAINAISGRFNNHFHDPLSGKGIGDFEFGV